MFVFFFRTNILYGGRFVYHIPLHFARFLAKALNIVAFFFVGGGGQKVFLRIQIDPDPILLRSGSGTNFLFSSDLGETLPHTSR